MFIILPMNEIKITIQRELRSQKKKADLSGFEPESEAPEASVISKLHYRPMDTAANPQKN